jgi:hypothetical protein
MARSAALLVLVVSGADVVGLDPEAAFPEPAALDSATSAFPVGTAAIPVAATALVVVEGNWLAYPQKICCWPW